MLKGDVLTDLIPKGVRMRALQGPGKWDKNWENGRLLIWEAPDRNAVYALGVDPGLGKGKDNSVIEVIRVGDSQRADEQVAEFASNIHGPVDLAEIAAYIGRFYGGSDGEALAVVECNTAGGGDVCLFDMRTRWDYGNVFVWKAHDRKTGQITNRFGWWTNAATRQKLIAKGLHAICEGDLILNSPFLMDEMEDFEGDFLLSKAKAKTGSHDDRVMAMLMGYWGAHDLEWMGGEDVARDRRRLTLAGNLRQAEVISGAPQVRRDFQNTAISAEDMDRAADDIVFGDFWGG